MDDCSLLVCAQITAYTLRSNAANVGSQLLTFGWSLFGGVDVDANDYNGD